MNKELITIDIECEKYEIEWNFYNDDKITIEYNIYNYDCLDVREHFASGFVKWDGCSNWSFPSQTTCMFHACTLKELTILSYIPMYCWKHASKRIESFEGSLE